MASDDTVQVKFGADASGVKEGAEQAKGAIEDFSKSADGISSALGRIGGAVVAAFSVDKISEFVKHTAEAAEQLERLHNISGLSTDTIQTLQFAMEQTGGDAEQTAMMISRLERNLYDAAAGSGHAFEAFAKLGVPLDVLQHSKPDEILNKMADGFKNITDPAERVNIAIALMGRSGASLIPVFLQGSAGLQQLGEKFTQTGDRMSKDMIEKTAQLGRDLKILGDAFEGVGRTILNYFVKPLDAAVRAISSLMEGINRGLGGSGETVLERLEREQRQAQSPALYSGVGPNLPGSLYNRNASGYSEIVAASAKAASDQELEVLKTNWEKELLAQKNVLEDMTAQELAYWKSVENDAKLGSDAKLKIKLEEFKLEQTLAKQAQDEQQKQAEEDAKVWRQAFDTIGSNFDAVFKGIMQGTQTLGQAWARFAQDMVVSFSEAVIRVLAQFSLLKAAQSFGWTNVTNALSGGGKSDQQSDLMSRMVDALFGLNTVTVANTVATTANTGALSSEAASGAAGAAGSGGGFLSGVGGFLGSLLPFDVGTPYVPKDMPAFIHEGEMIIPRQQSDALRSGEASIGGGAGSVHFHISSMDASGVAGMMRRHSGAISAAILSAARGGNGALRTAFSRM